jgi:arylsulfatase A-like enzyme
MRIRTSFAAISVSAAAFLTNAAYAAPPNVILIITDDQGYGDIGTHGNTMLRTPNLDLLHAESVRLTDFHVDPTCAPTRSSLMTGRFSTRTGIWHTIGGRSLMDPRELTMAQVFKANGYRTGHFGKWHLGDNAPLRPHDRGFDESLYCGGGGVTQLPDWYGNDYFDDTYRRNGVPEKCQGYCTDVFFREAMSFIERNREQPFFCYVATNAPHSPYNVAEEGKRPYLERGVPQPMASFYGMIANIDANIGTLLDRVEELGLRENTIVIFMTDNGTAAGIIHPPEGTPLEGKDKFQIWRGFNAGMREQKVSQYDGGHRVPCFIRWPGGHIDGGRDVAQLTAHIDLLPTLIDLCGLKKPDGPTIDGLSIKGLLRGDQNSLPDRTLFIHTQRVEIPEKWRLSAVLTERWRLINGKELYDIDADPGQSHEIAAQHADVVASLRNDYEQWWDSLTPIYAEYVAIDVGNITENPTYLTAHDWHALEGQATRAVVMQDSVPKEPQSNGFWFVNVVEPGTYEFTLRSRPEHAASAMNATRARVKVAVHEIAGDLTADATSATLTLQLEVGRQRLQTWLIGPGETSRGAYFVEVRKLP